MTHGSNLVRVNLDIKKSGNYSNYTNEFNGNGTTTNPFYRIIKGSTGEYQEEHHFGSYIQSKLRGTRRKGQNCALKSSQLCRTGQNKRCVLYDFKFTSVYSGGGIGIIRIKSGYIIIIKFLIKPRCIKPCVVERKPRFIFKITFDVLF